MQIYDAFLKAADFIEQNPRRLNMTVTTKPSGGDDQGCALAWAGAFAGKNFSHADDLLRFTPHSSFHRFLATLYALVPSVRADDRFVPQAMRAYANAYLKDFVPAVACIQRLDSLVSPVFTELPRSVMQIFDTGVFAKEFEKVAA